MKWISIEKQKPKEGKEIIAVNDHDERIIGYAIYDGRILCCENDNEMISHVVFWLPVPKLPPFN